MMTNRRSPRKWGPIVILAALALVAGGLGTAQAQVGQSAPLPGSSIPQWVNQLPTLALGGGTMDNVVLPGASTTNLFMRAFRSNILPPLTPTLLPYAGTRVFGYRTANTSATQDTYIGPVFVTTRSVPTAVNYTNNLGQTGDPLVPPFWSASVDQTLHWADPTMQMGSFANYTGPIPAVPHLHGGEVPAAIDGGPDAWFLSDAYYANPANFPGYMPHGKGYYNFANGAGTNFCIYRYPNEQEAAPIWFHDHLLGGTRLNVYAGLAGGYLLIDPGLTLPAGMNAVGLNNGTLDLSGAIPNGANTELTVPLVLQDRMFTADTGELYFPNLGINPTIHPFWIPEFVGDSIVVNGKAWPNLNVQAKRYRFLMINGSNARTYELSLGNNVPFYVIGTDGGYLDNAVKVTKLVIMPGERYQLIIDFGKYAGKTILMTNTGRTPYPKGTPPAGSTLGRIVQFTVAPAVAGFVDNSYNPALTPGIRTGSQVIQRLVTPPGTINPLVPIAKYRQLTLNEIMGPLGPQEILVNNTKWSGKRPNESVPTGFQSDGIGAYLSEVPDEGTTEVWEIINLTADAHPIHTHLTQFQVLNRQNFNVNNYLKTYGAAFPGGSGLDMLTGGPANFAAGVYTPAFGPPYNYDNSNNPIIFANPTVGGNPDVTPFLQGMATPADPNEQGWKDTVRAMPGQVTRIVVRYMPLSTTAGTTANYPFTPNPPNSNADGDLPNYDFVWHCHIVDHEDNEMMRPYQVAPADIEDNRSYKQGTAY
jgi:FtsP/CotA-like multicopper oxidase with cupredoxin domain